MTATLRRRRPWRWLIGVPLLLACGIATAFAFLPAAEDAPIPFSEQGGGARQSEASVNGLQAPFPDLPLVDPEQAALGRLLFYDPVLSANDDLACASCHQPDLGFSDGRAVAQGAHGENLRRNAPSLWNVAYADSLFWDGRAKSLEDQMLVPLTSADEMGADVDGMLAQLSTIPEYVEGFGGEITVEKVADALAAFERTLISRDAPFDRYAAGDVNALTPAQRRGFEVFRSAQTRCFECHAFPTFSSSGFHVLGVPDTDPAQPDLGQVETSANAPDAERAFKVPGLRNVALSAPYMHNGAFATLEDVVDFYARGGGEGITTDTFIRGFTLTDQHESDLIAFLYALTDEPPDLIAIPDSVPSGLPVVQQVENPARALVEHSTAAPFSAESRAPQTIRVQAGESIQAAVDGALPGDTVLVEPGVYHETVYVDTPNLTIRGVVRATSGSDQRPWIDGQGTLSDGFNTTGDNFTLEGFGVRDMIGNGVLTTGAEHVIYRDLIIENTGIYGVYPVECTDLLIENLTVTGIADAAIYVGQSRGPIVVRNNTVYGNVTGIEIENSTDADVYGNHTYDNTGGILVFVLPNTPSRVGYGTRIHDNLIENNNHANFGAQNAIVSKVPPGTGVMIITADNTEVFNNTIRGNKSWGVGLTSLYLIYPRDTVFTLGPLPENNWIHDNVYENNGYDPDPVLTDYGVPGADILWTGEGWSNSFDEPNASRFPPVLPSRSTPDPLKRALWRTYDVLIGLLM